jgi:diketogulonate reductase-like aldo/keto reductase
MIRRALLLFWVCMTTNNISSLLLRLLTFGKHYNVSSFINNHQRHRRGSPALFYKSKQQEQQQPPIFPKRSILAPLPHVPTLDTSGLLPPATYYDTTIPNSTIAIPAGIEHKPTCRIQIAWDISLQQPQHGASIGGEMNEITKEDVCNMVSNMQHAMDHGLTTFQLKPYIASSTTNQLQYDIYRTLMDQTPKSILEQQSQIIVPLCIDDVLESTDSTSAIKSISSKSVRTHILTLLDRLGIDCLDNVQIQFPDSVVDSGRRDATKITTKNNHLTSIVGYDPMTAQYSNKMRVDDRYYFDLIYELQELVREGYIRSISSRDLTNTMHQQIQNNQLHSLLNTNQMDLNLCHVSPLIKTQHETDQYGNKDSFFTPQHTIAANPLAGGWLVDRYFEPRRHLRQKRPTSTWFRSLSLQEQWNWDRNIVQSWMSSRQIAGSVGHDFDSVWSVYQTELMQPLRNVARKHGVSIASVVLRWTLQQHEHAQSPNGALCRHTAACSSTVISCRLLPEHIYWDTHRPFTTVVERVQQIREVFRFKLDNDDIETLWDLSSYVEPVQQLSSHDNNNYYDDDIEVTSTGLFIPKR